MAINEQPCLYTPEEYLALEREAEYKSEYLNGYIYAMAGGSPEHNAVIFNISGIFAPFLRGKPCRGFSSDMRIRTSPSGLYSYPDLSIVCGEPTYHDAKRDVLTNPTVIVEVLSPTTEEFDRGKKFLMYQQLESLTDYLLVSQAEARIDHYAKQSADHWLLTIARGLESSIHIASLGCTVLLSQVYDKVEFPRIALSPSPESVK